MSKITVHAVHLQACSVMVLCGLGDHIWGCHYPFFSGDPFRCLCFISALYPSHRWPWCCQHHCWDHDQNQSGQSHMLCFMQLCNQVKHLLFDLWYIYFISFICTNFYNYCNSNFLFMVVSAISIFVLIKQKLTAITHCNVIFEALCVSSVVYIRDCLTKLALIYVLKKFWLANTVIIWRHGFLTVHYRGKITEWSKWILDCRSWKCSC